jgi:hypothetical protein
MSLNFPDEPNDGDIFEGYVYNATRNVWDIKLPSDNNIEDLNNVNLTSPANGQALVYNTTSSNWVNQNQTFSGLTDTSFASPVTGDSLVYSGTNWVNGPRSGNAIINGDFGIWQRGASFTGITSAVYTSDRWTAGRNSAIGGLDVTRSTDAPDGFNFSVKLQRVADNTSELSILLGQRLEGVGKRFAGQTITYSFYAKLGANASFSVINSRIRTASTETANYTSTNGAMANTSTGYTSGVTVNHLTDLSTSWTRVSASYTIPSNADALQFFILLDPTGTAGADDSIYITGVQLEAGPVATPFKLAGGGSKEAEFALCERYYQIIKDINTDGLLLTRANTTATSYYGDFVLRVRPRKESSDIFNYVIIAPTTVLHKPNVRWDTISSIGLSYQNQRLFVTLTPGTNDTASYGLTLHGVAVYMNAEL